jgi:hypothetical protein
MLWLVYELGEVIIDVSSVSDEQRDDHSSLFVERALCTQIYMTDCHTFLSINVVYHKYQGAKRSQGEYEQGARRLG